jgi:hypothetical protein
MAANYVQPLISLKAAATVASPTGLPAALCAIALTVVEVSADFFWQSLTILTMSAGNRCEFNLLVQSLT